MMLVLFVVGLALVALAFIVSARMNRETPFGDRIGAAAAGGTGILAAIASTIRPDLLMPTLACLVLCAAWFALYPPGELAPQRHDDGTRQDA